VFDWSAKECSRDAAWVPIAGELSVKTVPLLERTLRWAQQSARLIILDLRELTAVDRDGVQAIVNAQASARRAGRRLIAVRGSFEVDRTFAHVAGPARALEIVDLDQGEPVILAIVRLAQQGRPKRRAPTQAWAAYSALRNDGQVDEAKAARRQLPAH
jgi:anti-anti-sigma factor